MVMGRRKPRQESLFVATDQLQPATGQDHHNDPIGPGGPAGSRQEEPHGRTASVAEYGDPQPSPSGTTGVEIRGPPNQSFVA